MAIRTGELPPTLNLDQADDGMETFNFVPKVSQSREVRNALCNAFGFGGVNASVALKRLI